MTGFQWARDRMVPLDENRLLKRLAELARIGADPRGGISRPGFSAPDRAAIDYVRGEALNSGLRARVDTAGNLVIGREPVATRPSLVMGSHLDTVGQGGPLDGAYGVVAALGAVEALAAADVPLALEPVAVAFANEEGARFPHPFWGSNAFAGRADRLPLDAADADGELLADALRLVGGDIHALDEAAWPAALLSAYLELHIEQGPVLERLGLPIGVVESIVGRTLFELEIVGTAGHAGTSPMEGRRDALVVASELVLAVRAIAADRELCRVATAGVLTVHPGNANVIPGVVSLTAEVRDTVPARLAAAERELLSQIEQVSARTGCAVRTRSITRIKPVPTDRGLTDLIAATAGDIGYAHTTMPSGAGHDAQIVAEAAPIGMIFVPSRAGRSHVPEEFTEPADLIAGARVLAACAANLCVTVDVPGREALGSGSIR